MAGGGKFGAALGVLSALALGCDTHTEATISGVEPSVAGLACPDSDDDGVCDSEDNCPNTGNAPQEDTDSDGIGDACDGMTCPVVLNFEQLASGAPLPAGTVLDDQFSYLGVSSVACTNNRSSGPHACIIFDSSAPTGGDPDLGTPNEDFGGPGRGAGGEAGKLGENSAPLGLVCIGAENIVDADSDGLVDDPDDEAAGYTQRFSFESPTTLEEIVILDVDSNEVGGSLMTCTTSHGAKVDIPIPVAGDNSVLRIPVNVENVVRLTVKMISSGAIAEISHCPTCAPTTCAALGANCGSVGDGCGGTLVCGVCPEGELCGGEGTPNVCGCLDPDGDGLCTGEDNCPDAANEDQTDTDGDLTGDACDTDDDEDGAPDSLDNCPVDANPSQEDTDNDGVGDACDDPDLFPPTLIVTAPLDGELSESPSVVVSGQILDESPVTVEVAGVPAVILGTMFETPPIAIEEGVTALEVIAADASGNVTSEIVRVAFSTTANAEVVDAEGGTLEVTDEGDPLFGVVVTVPPDAVTEPTLITLRISDISIPAPGAGVSVPVEVLSSSAFLAPVVLTVPYDMEALSLAGAAEEDLKVYRIEEGESAWELLPGATVDVDGDTSTAAVTMFSTFQVVVDGLGTQVRSFVKFAAQPVPPLAPSIRGFGFLDDGAMTLATSTFENGNMLVAQLRRFDAARGRVGVSAESTLISTLVEGVFLESDEVVPVVTAMAGHPNSQRITWARCVDPDVMLGGPAPRCSNPSQCACGLTTFDGFGSIVDSTLVPTSLTDTPQRVLDMDVTREGLILLLIQEPQGDRVGVFNPASTDALLPDGRQVPLRGFLTLFGEGTSQDDGPTLGFSLQRSTALGLTAKSRYDAFDGLVFFADGRGLTPRVRVANLAADASEVAGQAVGAEEIVTLAGGGTMPPSDGIAAAESGLSEVRDLASPLKAGLYFTDGERVRALTPSGMLATVAGLVSGEPIEDGAPALSGTYGSVDRLEVTRFGEILLADQESFLAYKVQVLPANCRVTERVAYLGPGPMADGSCGTELLVSHGKDIKPILAELDAPTPGFGSLPTNLGVFTPGALRVLTRSGPPGAASFVWVRPSELTIPLTVALSDDRIDIDVPFVGTEEHIGGIIRADSTAEGFALTLSDFDLDGVPNDLDGCPLDEDPGQEDADMDGVGDVCDRDADNDGFDVDDLLNADCDDSDPTVFPGAAEQCDTVDSDCNGSLVDGFDDSDTDLDPDCTDPDDDNDGFLDEDDNCPQDVNLLQNDLDGDGDGDACDSDADADGVPDSEDCDDLDPEINPDAADLCDHIDSDCDGDLNDGCAGFIDRNGDGEDDRIAIVLRVSAGRAIQADASDYDSDGITDYEELFALDGNLDGTITVSEVEAAYDNVPDQDGDGTPDVLESSVCATSVNCTCAIDGVSDQELFTLETMPESPVWVAEIGMSTEYDVRLPYILQSAPPGTRQVDANTRSIRIRGTASTESRYILVHSTVYSSFDSEFPDAMLSQSRAAACSASSSQFPSWLALEVPLNGPAVPGELEEGGTLQSWTIESCVADIRGTYIAGGVLSPDPWEFSTECVSSTPPEEPQRMASATDGSGRTFFVASRTGSRDSASLSLSGALPEDAANAIAALLRIREIHSCVTPGACSVANIDSESDFLMEAWALGQTPVVDSSSPEILQTVDGRQVGPFASLNASLLRSQTSFQRAISASQRTKEAFDERDEFITSGTLTASPLSMEFMRSSGTRYGFDKFEAGKLTPPLDYVSLAAANAQPQFTVVSAIPSTLAGRIGVQFAHACGPSFSLVYDDITDQLEILTALQLPSGEMFSCPVVATTLNNGPVLGTFDVQVFAPQIVNISAVVLAQPSVPPPTAPQGFRTYVDEIVRQGVFEVGSLTEATLELPYDRNQNGVLDICFFCGDELSPWLDDIDLIDAGLTGLPYPRAVFINDAQDHISIRYVPLGDMVPSQIGIHPSDNFFCPGQTLALGPSSSNPLSSALRTYRVDAVSQPMDVETPVGPTTVVLLDLTPLQPGGLGREMNYLAPFDLDPTNDGPPEPLDTLVTPLLGFAIAQGTFIGMDMLDPAPNGSGANTTAHELLHSDPFGNLLDLGSDESDNIMLSRGIPTDTLLRARRVRQVEGLSGCGPEAGFDQQWKRMHRIPEVSP